MVLRSSPVRPGLSVASRAPVFSPLGPGAQRVPSNVNMRSFVGTRKRHDRRLVNFSRSALHLTGDVSVNFKRDSFPLDRRHISHRLCDHTSSTRAPLAPLIRTSRITLAGLVFQK